MKQQISREKQNEILYWRKSGKALRWIATKIGVARQTCTKIIKRRQAEDPDDGDITFYEVSTYDCACGHRVTLRPCPYCEAMKYKQSHGG
jgi:IS30 family transposase